MSSTGAADPANTKAPTLGSSSDGQRNTGTANLSTATKTTDSSMSSTGNTLTFGQIEEYINKWTLELEEQQKTFTNQATTINAWDKLLISNNDKIMNLNDAVKKIQADQRTLEQELEFISTQHSELEEAMVPLQKELRNVTQVDMERLQIYTLIENLDTQLKQMSEDLKEVVDDLNETNKDQNQNDPINQIGRILNAHMNSLQWIESVSTVIGSKLDQLSKVQETLQRSSERSVLFPYNN